MNTKEIESLAREFIEQLRADLTDEQIAEIVARNKAEQNPNVCHSHDFCDANEYMLEAFQETFPGKAWHELDTTDGRWSAAWDLAKKWEFKCPS